MCGRYLIDDEVYADMWMMLSSVADAVHPVASSQQDALVRGEVFPTNIAPVMFNGKTAAAKWGFPHWKNAGVIINARAETAMQKRMFSKPLMESRCVIPSSGFYEWNRSIDGKEKNKFLLRQPGERLLYMAGIIGTFRDENNADYSAFVILTTNANDSVSPIHDRMPVILAHDERNHWINDDTFVEHVLHRTGPELMHIKQEAG